MDKESGRSLEQRKVGAGSLSPSEAARLCFGVMAKSSQESTLPPWSIARCTMAVEIPPFHQQPPGKYLA